MPHSVGSANYRNVVRLVLGGPEKTPVRDGEADTIPGPYGVIPAQARAEVLSGCS